MRRTQHTFKLDPPEIGLALLAARRAAVPYPASRPEFTLEVAVEVENTRGEATLLACRLLIDGRVAGDDRSSGPLRRLRLRCAGGAAVPGTGRRIALRVTRQSGERVPYRVSGEATIQRFGREILRERLFPIRGRLAEGEELVWIFNFQVN